MVCFRLLLIVFSLVVFLDNEAFALNSNDTLVIDGQKVYLEEESVDKTDTAWQKFGQSDFRELRPATRWGVQLELGGGWVNPSWIGDSVLAVVASMNPKNSTHQYTKSVGLSGYAMLNQHWGWGVGFQQTQWERRSELANVIPQDEEEHDKVFGYYYDPNGFWQVRKVPVGLGGLFELDTFLVNTTSFQSKVKRSQVPLYAIYNGNFGRSSWEYQAQLGMTWTQIQAGSVQMSVIENTLYLHNITLDRVNEIHWSAQSKFMLRKRWFQSVYTFAAVAYQWNPQLPNPRIVGKLNSPVNLTFGMAWEY
ncbi:MAG: hypothetical protein RL062_630 [Bacteroidota bacterium]